MHAYRWIQAHSHAVKIFLFYTFHCDFYSPVDCTMWKFCISQMNAQFFLCTKIDKKGVKDFGKMSHETKAAHLIICCAVLLPLYSNTAFVSIICRHSFNSIFNFSFVTQIPLNNKCIESNVIPSNRVLIELRICTVHTWWNERFSEYIIINAI